MKNISQIILLFCIQFILCQNLSAQKTGEDIDSLKIKISFLSSENDILKRDIHNLRYELSKSISLIDTLRKKIEINNKLIKDLNKDLNDKISVTESNTNYKITKVDESLNKNTLLGIIGVLFAVIFSMILYWILSNRRKSDQNRFENEIENAKQSIMKESAHLDTKLAELLESHLKIIQEERNLYEKNGVDETSEIDHSLPLKVADEITRINIYANTLDPNSQDSKALKSSVKRLANTFKAANYEIVDLLGQKYNDGLKVIVVNATPDESLSPGEEIITRIIKPLVRYKGEQIQAAHVDISIGPKTS